MRCYWCDNDAFKGISPSGEVLPLSELRSLNLAPKDYSCTHCGHLASEPNPRGGDPKETVASLKEERDELRLELEQAMAEIQQNDEA